MKFEVIEKTKDVKTEVAEIKKVGCFVRTVFLAGDGGDTIFVPGVKLEDKELVPLR